MEAESGSRSWPQNYSTTARLMPRGSARRRCRDASRSGSNKLTMINARRPRPRGRPSLESACLPNVPLTEDRSLREIRPRPCSRTLMRRSVEALGLKRRQVTDFTRPYDFTYEREAEVFARWRRV